MTEFIVTWSDLMELIPLGLKLDKPRIFEDRDGSLVEIIFPSIEMSEAVMQRSKNIEKARKKPGMGKVLTDMWQKANAHPGATQRIADLGGGLGVDLNVGIDGVVRYQIFRERVSPSENEWSVMLRYLPVPVEATEVKRFVYKSKQYIQAQLLLVAERIE